MACLPRKTPGLPSRFYSPFRSRHRSGTMDPSPGFKFLQGVRPCAGFVFLGQGFPVRSNATRGGRGAMGRGGPSWRSALFGLILDRRSLRPLQATKGQLPRARIRFGTVVACEQVFDLLFQGVGYGLQRAELRCVSPVFQPDQRGPARFLPFWPGLPGSTRPPP